ncbi:MAG: LPXTG cell wall anchor domain-containing protein [Acidimicrobiales bacterium]
MRKARLRFGFVVMAMAWFASLGAVFAAPAATAAPAAVPSDCLGYLSSDLTLYLACSAGPQVEVSPATISSCQQVTVTATGFLPNSTADVTLEANGTSIALGQVSIGATAGGTATFSVPATFPLGPATATTAGTNMLGKAFSQPSPVTVSACSPDTTPTSSIISTTSIISGTTTSGSLPRTGSDSGRLIGIGAGLIVLGGAAVYGSLRSRRSAQGTSGS